MVGLEEKAKILKKEGRHLRVMQPLIVCVYKC